MHDAEQIRRFREMSPAQRMEIWRELTALGVPDSDHLRGWAQRLGVSDRLAKAIRTAGLEAGT